MYEYINSATGQSLGISPEPEGAIQIEGIEIEVRPYKPPAPKVPTAAERIAFLRKLKAQILDITTGLALSPEQVFQLAQEMEGFSRLVEIGADETLLWAVQQLPDDHPVLGGELRQKIINELTAYIASYNS